MTANTVQSRKSKGRLLQQYLRDAILEKFPLEPDDVRSTSMGASGNDLLLSPRGREFFPFNGIECKAVEKVNLWQSWDQAKTHGEPAVLVIRKSYREPLAVITVKQLLDLLEK